MPLIELALFLLGGISSIGWLFVEHIVGVVSNVPELVLVPPTYVCSGTKVHLS